jgi:lichenan operon transcriptional antiterminator
MREKTVRTRLKELGSILKYQGCLLVSKPKFGFRIEILDKDKYQIFLDSLKEQGRLVSVTSTDRVFSILSCLLNDPAYVTIDDLSYEFLNVSRNTVTSDLKKVEHILMQYELTIERRPYHGIRVVGSEFNKRICLVNHTLKINPFIGKNRKMPQKQQKIASVLFSVINEKQLKISEISFENLIFHIDVAINRIVQKQEIELDCKTVIQSIGEAFLDLSSFLCKKLEDQFPVKFTEGECAYIAIHLAGKISSEANVMRPTNLEITAIIDKLCLSMIGAIYEGFKVNFWDDLNFRMSLNQHLVPLGIRMKYGIPLSNPILSAIKQEHPFSYAVAAQACTVLQDYYDRQIPEDEVGYIALLVEFALEKKGKEINKKNIVIVCASGKGSAQLFIYKYKNAFGKYIDKIHECSVFELEGFDFMDVDYVFTTVPIHTPVPVPIFNVDLFFDYAETMRIQKVFEQRDTAAASRFYSEELFFLDYPAKSKKDVIEFLCIEIGKRHTIPDNFYEMVMKREALGQTDFGINTAIPHPISVLTKESFVAVCVLQNPIWWGHNDVQVVFLLSIAAEGDNDIQNFFQLTTELIFNIDKMKALIEAPSYEMLMNLLSAG